VSGADAFTIMQLMGIRESSYRNAMCIRVHPAPEAVELAYERLNSLNLRRVPTKTPTTDEGKIAVVQ